MNRLNTENINGLVSIYADNLATRYFDADTSGNIYGTSLYINNQLINFASYITSSYLSSYLSNYVTNSSLSSTLSNYATYGALGSYRLISDSWSRGDTTNEIMIRVGNCGTNSDGSIKTAKTYCDESVATVSAFTATNTGAIAGLVAWQSATSATIAVMEGEIATIQGEITTIDGQITTLETDVTALQTKTQNQTATVGNTKLTGTLQMTDGINNNVTLNQTGDITCLTETVNTLTCNTQLTGNGRLNLQNSTQDHTLVGNSITLGQAGKNNIVYGNTYIGAYGSTVQLYGTNVNINNSNSLSNLSVTTIGGSFQTVFINGAVYINGILFVPFSTGSSGGQWSYPNI